MKSSKGEEKIISILKKEKISFEREKQFPDMKKHGNKLRLDFFLKNNIAVEFQGEQHYKFNSHFYKDRRDFYTRQEYDRYKISYCLSHGIKLYIIPYWELDNIKESKDLFQKKFLAASRWKNDLDWKKYKNTKIKRGYSPRF